MLEKIALFDLLNESFPRIKENIIRRGELGFSWQSKAFLKEEKGELLAHVGFLDYPIIAEGRLAKVGALHAVCTKQRYRKQGLASELIKEAIEFASPSYECVVLFTEIPDFYKKLGFKKIQEHRFHLPYSHQAGQEISEPLIVPRDNSLFIESFKNREVLSKRLWMQDNGIIASFNTLFMTYPKFWSLHHIPSVNCLISYELKEGTLHLYDIIANKIPPLDRILNAIPSPFERIYFYFSPDRLTNEAIAEPYMYDGYLMAYGNWLTSKPFMISPLSRC